MTLNCCTFEFSRNFASIRHCVLYYDSPGGATIPSLSRADLCVSWAFLLNIDATATGLLVVVGLHSTDRVIVSVEGIIVHSVLVVTRCYQQHRISSSSWHSTGHLHRLTGCCIIIIIYTYSPHIYIRASIYVRIYYIMTSTTRLLTVHVTPARSLQHWTTLVAVITKIWEFFYKKYSEYIDYNRQGLVRGKSEWQNSTASTQLKFIEKR